MAISQFANYINPLIAALKTLGGSARPNEVCALIAEDLNLSNAILDETLRNGVSRFENQVHWARFYLARLGFIDSSRHGVWSLTEKGRSVTGFNETDLRQIIQDVQGLTSKSSRDNSADMEIESGAFEEQNPVEGVDQDYKEQLLQILKKMPPGGFERICQRLLREAGFEKVNVTGRSGDGGIDGDGVLQINPFVSFRVLFQCKRYDGSVGAPQIRDFRGAMMGRSEKGIIITTGNFTSDAKRESIRDGVPPIELVDGEKLVEMFERLELGLKPRTTFDLDESFFQDFNN